MDYIESICNWDISISMSISISISMFISTYILCIYKPYIYISLYIHIIHTYIYIYILWMEEILHQLIDGKHPIIYRVDEASKLVQDFPTIHSMYVLTNG